MSEYVRTLQIEGKQVFVVDDHEFALVAWAKIRRTAAKAPLLISLDHHTDTHLAFRQEISRGFKQRDDDAFMREVGARCRAIDFKNEESVVAAAQKLNFDEQIDAGVRADIIAAACVVHHAICEVTVEARACPDSALIVEVPITCHPKEHADRVLETEVLVEAFAAVKRRLECDVLATRFILDVDLDFFHTTRALVPRDSSLFHEIIRKSCAVTIAVEKGCVRSLAEGETLEPSALLERLQQHILEAEKKE